MKAPDRIYMPNELLSEEWTRHIEGQDTDYIRKDALIEWALNRKGMCTAHMPFVDGERKILRELIEKLNSM